VASSGGERKHLPVYSRLALTRQPSSDRLLARHESCSAPSASTPIRAKSARVYRCRARAYVCVCVCVCVRASVDARVCAHDQARYQAVCRRQPAAVNFFYRLSARCLSDPLILPATPPAPASSRLPRLASPQVSPAQIRKGWKEGRRADGGGISSTKYGCTCLHIPVPYVEYGRVQGRRRGRGEVDL